ncbi:hypothetical protein RIF29_18114 [Crotalaria pallida]|uniref:Uncharacterized protein n=1 Tax=Crotalaria pallida TaxID=3830 RepID=A0AAN9FJC0_CROPI
MGMHKGMLISPCEKASPPPPLSTYLSYSLHHHHLLAILYMVQLLHMRQAKASALLAPTALGAQWLSILSSTVVAVAVAVV